MLLEFLKPYLRKFTLEPYHASKLIHVIDAETPAAVTATLNHKKMTSIKTKNYNFPIKLLANLSILTRQSPR